MLHAVNPVFLLVLHEKVPPCIHFSRQARMPGLDKPVINPDTTLNPHTSLDLLLLAQISSTYQITAKFGISAQLLNMPSKGSYVEQLISLGKYDTECYDSDLIKDFLKVMNISTIPLETDVQDDSARISSLKMKETVFEMKLNLLAIYSEYQRRGLKDTHINLVKDLTMAGVQIASIILTEGSHITNEGSQKNESHLAIIKSMMSIQGVEKHPFALPR